MAVVLREPQITLDEIKAKAATAHVLVYGAMTCWWRVLDEGESIGYALPNRRPNDPTPGLPCDPRGGVLFQTSPSRPEEVRGFIAAAEGNPEHYGRHGIAAFVTAYHGNVLAAGGLPTCLRTWDDYNALLDGAAPGEKA